MPLPDDLTVYPAHGAGSACGKNMSKETTNTLGNQKKTNYALRPDMSLEILLVTDPGRELEVVTRLARVGYDLQLHPKIKRLRRFNPL